MIVWAVKGIFYKKDALEFLLLDSRYFIKIIDPFTTLKSVYRFKGIDIIRAFEQKTADPLLRDQRFPLFHFVV